MCLNNSARGCTELGQRAGAERGANGMKPVMYHYVRPCAEGLPHFPYLALANFERQLDTFASTYGFVGREAFVDWVQGGPGP